MEWLRLHRLVHHANCILNFHETTVSFRCPRARAFRKVKSQLETRNDLNVQEAEKEDERERERQREMLFIVTDQVER